MSLAFQALSASGPLAALPLLRLEHCGPVLHIRLNRPAKRNSISDEMLAQLHTVFVNLPRDFRAAVISGEGEHFCAGLDLSEVSERSVAEGIHHSRAWHACFDAIQFGPVPVIAVLHGAVSAADSNWPRRRTCAWPKPAPSTACPKARAASSSAAAARCASRG